MNKKDEIIKKVFKLFLSNPYDSISVTDIENVTGTSRGTIFYHIKNKEELFRIVVERNLLRIHTLEFESKYPKNCYTLREFIYHYVNGVKYVIEQSNALEVKNIHRDYFYFMFQAFHYFDDITQQFNEIADQELEYWKKIVQTAYDEKEIKPTVNVDNVAKHFRLIYSGLAVETSIRGGINPKELLELYLSYYNIIKL